MNKMQIRRLTKARIRRAIKQMKAHDALMSRMGALTKMIMRQPDIDKVRQEMVH